MRGEFPEPGCAVDYAQVRLDILARHERFLVCAKDEQRAGHDYLAEAFIRAAHNLERDLRRANDAHRAVLAEIAESQERAQRQLYGPPCRFPERGRP